MIAKVGSSTSINGTLSYLGDNEQRVEWKEGVHLAETDKDFVRKQMNKTAQLSRTDSPIYHYSLSWDPADNPTRQQMSDAARFTLKELGMEDHQALIVAHNDHDYKHVHIMANRVHPIKGTAWDKWGDYKKLERCLRWLERSHNWREVPGHHHRLEGQVKPEYGKTLNRFEVEQIKRYEKPLFLSIRELAMEDFREAKSWSELHHRLAEKGLTIQRGSRGTGGKVTDGHEYVNLSKVHRDFSMKRLEERFGPFKSLTTLQVSQKLTQKQALFLAFERAQRQNRRDAQKLLKMLKKQLGGMKEVSQISNTIQSFRAVTTASNPALGIVSQIGKKLMHQIKSQLKQQEKDRGLSL